MNDPKQPQPFCEPGWPPDPTKLAPPPEIKHARDCVAVLDDDSDYEHLSDAGTCTCGALPFDPEPAGGAP